MRRGLIVFAASVLVPLLAQAQDVEWEQLPHLPKEDSAYYASDIAFRSDTLYAASSDGVLRITPRTETWEHLLGDSSSRTIAVTAEGYLVAEAFLVGIEADLFRSTDAGATWDGVSDIRPGHLWRAERGPHTATLFASARPILRSTDSGASWQLTAMPAPSPTSFDDFAALGSEPPGDGALLVACIFGVLRSADGGATWEPTPIYGVNQYTAYALAALGGGRAVAVLGGGAVYLSEDGGRTWSPVGNLGEAVRLASLPAVGAEDRTVLYAAGRFTGTIFRSEDDGATWTEVGQVSGDGEPLRVPDLMAGPDGRLYAAVNKAGPATPEDGVYRTTAPVSVTVASEEGPSEFEGFRLGTPYPNPSAGGTTVPLVIERAAEARVTVYDMLGREVSVLHDGLLAAGAHRLKLEDGTLPAGPYLVRLEAGGTVHTQRLILVH